MQNADDRDSKANLDIITAAVSAVGNMSRNNTSQIKQVFRCW